MTNTRITDPEILEKRYPIVLRKFSLREGSGGAGKFKGGEGVVRELQFTKPLIVSILSERRAFEPWGLQGGGNGSRGQNLLYTLDGRLINIGGKNTVEVVPGDKLVIKSPGGGGYGKAADDKSDVEIKGNSSSSSSSSSSNSSSAVFISGSLNQYSMDQESA
jgi:5-oxoprolinase (ATP-hydrolysing)